MSNHSISLKWLIYTFLIGFSANACFSILTITLVPFSPFPFISLFFTVHCFYKKYLQETGNETTIRPAWAAFFIGLFSYSAFLSATYPELGSNFISIALTLILSIWLMYKLMFGDKRYSA